MGPNDLGVDQARITRRIYQSTLEDWLKAPIGLGAGMVLALACGFIYPVSLWLSVPALFLWSPLMLLEQWQMPMRMPADMDRLDPSTQRSVPGKLFGFLPITAMRIAMDSAAGIMYMGYLRGRDAGRELWMSLDDMLRHIIMFATTGAGKTEALLGYVLGQLSFGKGLIYSDGKAQNDVAIAITVLCKRYGREDDVRHMSFINGGRSRAQDLLDGKKGRGQTNTINAFGIAQETYIFNLMDSMLPKAGNDGGWQEKARGMMQPLVFTLVYKCRREGTVFSQRTIQEHLPLRSFAKLYIQAEQEQWHLEALLPIKNYLSTLSGFDLAKVDSPEEWAPEATLQHGYLIGQFNRMLSLFNDTYGHVFALDAGDIDPKDVIHNDRILTVLIPALEVSSNEASTLGRLYVSQLAMILAQDLGERLEGKPEDIMVVRKYRDRFPFLWILDELGAYYTEKIGEAATQVRSLGYCMLLASQEVQRLKSAVGDMIWTLIANMGTRITGKILDPKDTLEILQLMAGNEYQAHMSSMVQTSGVMGPGWEESGTLSLHSEKKVSVTEVQQLQEGENITLFRGQVIRGNSLYIRDADKFSKEAIRINRFIEVQRPGLELLLSHSSNKVRRSYPRADRVQHILRHLDVEPGRFDLESIILTDPMLAALNNLDLEWKHIWARRPSAAVRSTMLWQTALRHLPRRGRGYQAQSDTAQALTVSRKKLDSYQAQHVVQAETNKGAAGSRYPQQPRQQGPQSGSSNWSQRRPSVPSVPDVDGFLMDDNNLQPPADLWD